MSTFSKLRVGKKGYLAGTAQLLIQVPGDAVATVGMLPPGAIILSAVANEASLVISITDGSTTAIATTNVTPGIPGSSDNVNTIAGASVISVTTAGTAAAVIGITYALEDAALGVNE